MLFCEASVPYLQRIRKTEPRHDSLVTLEMENLTGRPTRRKKYLEKGAEYVVPKSTRHYHHQKKARLAESALGSAAALSVPSADPPGHSAPGVSLQQPATPTDEQQFLPESTAVDNSQQRPGNDGVGSTASLAEDEHHWEDQDGGGADPQSDWDDLSDFGDSDSLGPSHEASVEEIVPEDDGSSRAPRDFVSDDREDLMGRCFSQFGTSTLPHSSTTKASAVAMLMSIVHAHNFTWGALDDILKLINKMFGQNQNVLPGSKYLFRKLWSQKTSTVSKKYYYCERANCSGLLQDDGTGKSTCALCSTSADEEAGRSYFTILDISQQVKHVIAKTKEVLSQNLDAIETSLSSSSVTDISSGCVYRNLKEAAVVKPGDLTLTVNTDGSPVFKSSRSSIWPIQFTVSELPPEERFRNTTLAGLWFGKKHPNMKLFMSKFADAVTEMDPIQWTYGTADYKSQVHLICCCADAPARAAVQNHVLYSGYFGCPWCLIKGEHVAGRLALCTSPLCDIIVQCWGLLLLIACLEVLLLWCKTVKR